MFAYSGSDEPITVYYSCAPEDRALLNQLDKHLTLLRRQRQIVTWHDGQIEPGKSRKQESAQHFEQAQVVLVLMSIHYIASDRCMLQMEQLAHGNPEAHIMLVLLRPTSGWEQTPLGHLSPLPINQPVTKWSNRDEAFNYVADEVGRVIERLILQRQQRRSDSGVIRLNQPQLHTTILPREALVKEIYTTLLRSDTSTVVLTGMKGVGKSTLAAQIFHHAEECRLRGDSPFSGETLWFKIEATSTMGDLITALAEALGQPSHAFRHLFLPHQHIPPFNFDRYTALELFNLITQSSVSHLIILDQFEEWLDIQTGHALMKHAAIGEWLDLMNAHSCFSRILLTSSIYPQGAHISHPMYMQEIHLDGLKEQEGMALLRLWGVVGSDRDLLLAVEGCQGHALALVLLDRIVHNRHLKLATVLDDLSYRQVWMKDVQHNLLDYIYEHQLHDAIQHRLLQAIAIYREAVSWQAICVIMQRDTQTTEAQILTALGGLQQYNLLQIHHSSEERYTLHPLVADFVREQHNQADSIGRQQAHLAAAHYYEQAFQALPVEKRQYASGMLIEAVWHFLQAEQWQEGYRVMEREHLFVDLQRWGKNTFLLDIYLLLLPTEKWQAETAQSARIQNQLGEIYFGLGQQQNAENCFAEALTFYKAAEIWEGEVKALNNLGAAYRWDGRIAQAIAYYREAEQLCQGMPEYPERGITLNNLGRAFQYLGQTEQVARNRKKHYQQALSYYQQAIVVYNVSNDVAEMARTLNNLGEVYEQLQRPDKAYTYYRQALKGFRELDEKREEGIVCNNLGVFYRRQDKRQQSFEYYLQALHIFREIGDRWQEAITLRNIGRFYMLLHRQDIALACFLLAKDIYEALRHPERGAIPSEIRRLLSGGQPLDALLEELHPQAFQIVEDALKNNPPDFMEQQS